MFKIVCFLVLSSFALSCSNELTSKLARSAIPNDPNVKVVRVSDGALIKFIMVSGNKGYELTCSDPMGLLRLIDATGFPNILLNSYPPLSMDAAADLKIEQQVQASYTQPRMAAPGCVKKIKQSQLPMYLP